MEAIKVGLPQDPGIFEFDLRENEYIEDTTRTPTRLIYGPLRVKIIHWSNGRMDIQVMGSVTKTG